MRIPSITSYHIRKKPLKQNLGIKNSTYISQQTVQAPVNNGAFSLNFRGNYDENKFVKPFNYEHYYFHNADELPEEFGLYIDGRNKNMIGIKNNSGINGARQAAYYHDGNMDYYGKPDYETREKEHRQLLEYVSNPENLDTYLPFYEIVFPTTHECDYGHGITYKNSGFIYIGKDGSIEYKKYPDQNYIKGMLSKEHVLKTVTSGLLEPSYVVFEMEKQGRLKELFDMTNLGIPMREASILVDIAVQKGQLDEVLSHYPKLISGDSYTDSKLISALLQEGRYDECLERYPSNSWMRSKNYPQDESGLINIANIQDAFNKKRKNAHDKFSTKAQEDSTELDKAIQSAKVSAFYDYKDDMGWWRVLLDVTTMGLFEITKLATWGIDRHSYIKHAKKSVQYNRNNSQAEIAKDVGQIQDELKNEDLQATYIKDRQEKIEKIKDIVFSKLFSRISSSTKGEQVDVPNCVMLTGANPYLMMEIIDWIGENSGADYIKIPSMADGGAMQDKLLEKLEKAEQNYQTTGRRSVIFLNGMEKLLKPNANSREDISCLKDLMSSADEDYHSTIIFYANQPQNLDIGATAPHRVGLKIDMSEK